MSERTQRRKDEHIKATVENDVACRVPSGFDDVTLIHCSVPELDLGEIETSTMLFGSELSYPCIISAITGGSLQAGKINARLARIAAEFGIGISVGSQRAMLESPSLKNTYDIRAAAPDALLFSNLGIAQAIGMDNDDVAQMVDAIGADVLAVHLNPLQEALQPEGDTDFRGGIERLKDLKKAIDVPLIVKETGAGISREVAEKLSFLDGIEVSGVGGTSFAAVEYHRAQTKSQKDRARLFWDWGIPTVPSLLETKDHHGAVIASGGVRNGVHIAKSIALGASCAGLAMPFLGAVYRKTAAESADIVEQLMQELKTAMFLVGAGTIDELSSAPYVLGGRTLEFIAQRR